MKTLFTLKLEVTVTTVVLVMIGLFGSTPAVAQRVQIGKVVDRETGLPIGGASVRVVGTTRGTYTRSSGEYRLPLEDGMDTIVVRSIGYREQRVAATPSESLVTKLEAVGVTKREVSVTGDIEPSEIIKRAIAHAVENDKRIRTMVNTTYSKMRVYLDVPDFGQPSSPKESITETVSAVYYQREPERLKHVKILQRRQTRNIPAADNLAVFDEFVDITQPEIRILNTRMVTPLGEDALDTYTYRITNKRQLSDHLVYDLEFEPTSRLYPGFEGTLSVVDGTYQTIAADFAPTTETAFPFVKHLRYVQRYEQVGDSIWAPMYQQITGDAAINVFVGMKDIVFKLSIEAYVTDVTVNGPIADSLLHPVVDTTENVDESQRSGVRVRVRGSEKAVTVAADADTSRPEYWDKHAFTEMSTEEAEAYRIADSIETHQLVKSESSKPSIGLLTIGDLGINILPVLTRTTITGFAFGGELEFIVGPVSLTTMGAWGEQGTKLGTVKLNTSVVSTKQVSVDVTGSVFSTYQTIQPPRDILGSPNFLNLNDLLYMEYNDYYRRDGWDAGVALQTSLVDGAITFTQARHLADRILTSPGRPQVTADVGNYQTLRLVATVNKPSFASEFFGSSSPVFGTVDAVVGRELNSQSSFATVSATVSLRLPTFATGYSPMHFDVDVTAATALTDWTPRQYQFSLLRRFPVLGSVTDLATVPVSRYGGTTMGMVHAEHNFSDLWWRFIGLPTFSNGRGLDLIALYGAGTTSHGSPQGPSTWLSTTSVYMEAGVAIARIPTFVSDLAYLRVDALWPVGALAHTGTFGWSVVLIGPLF